MSFRPIIVAVIVSGALFASQAPQKLASVKHLYVDPFTVKDGSTTLRRDLIAQLRKVKLIDIVTERSSADAVLTGTGEIWIKGYRSLNPRSGRLPSNGTPVYTAYLSVELKNSQGETIWSYLETPGAGSEDIAKALSGRIAKRLSDDLAAAPGALSVQSIRLSAAGATFPAPIYEKWFASYAGRAPGVQFSYQSVGSEAGVRKLLNGEIDLGASDNPNILKELAPSSQDKFLFFPSVVGAVVPIVNLPGFPSDLSFTPEALAGIYLGKIKKWNDPLLTKLNPGLRLPNLDINVIHRSDGSGTSYAFSAFLSRTVADWNTQVGASLNPKWACGRGADGNSGVANLVKELGGSIGYVEYIYALQTHLSFGKVQNSQGRFVQANLESVQKAAANLDSPGPDSYPIASLTWFVIPSHVEDTNKREAIKGFLQWMIGPGQRQAAALGYAALPQALVQSEAAMLAKWQ